MDLMQDNDKMLYIRLCEWIEDEILVGTFVENGQIPSVADVSAGFRINHMTVLKSVSILTDSGIIYKKRGVGMFVSEGAAEKIREKRRVAFYDKYVASTAQEAKKLGIDLHELLKMTERGYKDE